jgi:hypothetical protein
VTRGKVSSTSGVSPIQNIGRIFDTQAFDTGLIALMQSYLSARSARSHRSAILIVSAIGIS